MQKVFWTGRQVNGWKDRQTDKQTNGQTNHKTDRLIKQQTNVKMNDYTTISNDPTDNQQGQGRELRQFKRRNADTDG